MIPLLSRFQPVSEIPRIWSPPYPHPACVTWTQLAEGPMRHECETLRAIYTKACENHKTHRNGRYYLVLMSDLGVSDILVTL